MKYLLTGIASMSVQRTPDGMKQHAKSYELALAPVKLNAWIAP
jgi:hypothetical protein